MDTIFKTLRVKATMVSVRLRIFSIRVNKYQQRQNCQVKRPVSSSLINYYSGVLHNFQNKTQRFLCMTLSSLSFVVFMDPLQVIYGLCLFSPLKICGIFGNLGIVTLPSLSHPNSNRLMWSS
jgi:hypothetical protein